MARSDQFAAGLNVEEYGRPDASLAGVTIVDMIRQEP
jgi:hypothetical protein